MSDSSRHPLVEVRVAPDRLELAESRLWELGASGLEERDATTLVTGTGSGSAVVVAAFPDDAAAERAFEAIRADYDADIIYVERKDWATEWRRGFTSRRIGTRLLLRPSWEAVEPASGDVLLTIDPENAFGSGDHETTRLVLQVLEREIAGGESVLDVGCGSGVLSIAAVLLGASSAEAIDIDDDAVATTKRNAALNGAAPRVHVSRRPLSDVSGAYDIVVANIETRVLAPLAPDLQARTAPSGFLVLSGVLRDDRDELVAAFSSMRLQETLDEGEWCACVLRPGKS
jgi:ribosomal protein L11 methyltransferase